MVEVDASAEVDRSVVEKIMDLRYSSYMHNRKKGAFRRFGRHTLMMGYGIGADEMREWEERYSREN